MSPFMSFFIILCLVFCHILYFIMSMFDFLKLTVDSFQFLIVSLLVYHVIYNTVFFMFLMKVGHNDFVILSLLLLLCYYCCFSYFYSDEYKVYIWYWKVILKVNLETLHRDKKLLKEVCLSFRKFWISVDDSDVTNYWYT